MVGRDDLPNAVGLNSASFNVGRIDRPGAGRPADRAGSAPGRSFLINAASFGAVIFALTRMRSAELRPVPRGRAGKGQVREGVRYVRRRPDLLLVMMRRRSSSAPSA